MGSPKPLLDFDGRPCLEVVLDVCRASGNTEVVVVLGHGASEVRAGCRVEPGVTMILNERHEAGQTRSVKVGLGAVRSGARAFYIFPADHPLVEAADIAALSARFESSPAGKTVFIPTFEGRRGHPVLMAAAHREAILGLGDAAPLHDHIRACAAEVEHVPVANSGVVCGINTEDEYRAALEEFRRRRGRVRPS